MTIPPEVGAHDEPPGELGGTPGPASRAQAAGALVNKGVALGMQGRLEDEIGVYDELLSRFGDAPEPVLRDAVARARRALPPAGGRH